MRAGPWYLAKGEVATVRSDERRIWSKCAEALKALDLPDDFDTDTLLNAISKQRGGRRITRRAADLSGSTPFGLVLQTRTRDAILYPRNTTRFHWEHIIAHEAGHLLLGHLPVPTDDEVSAAGGVNEMLNQLVPDLYPDLQPEFGGRTTFRESQENEAELFATMVRTRALPSGGHVPAPRAIEQLPAGLRALFDVPLRTDDEASCV